MKVEGLGEARKAELFQIRTLVEEVKGFSSEKFQRMVGQYKEQDPIMHQILNEAAQIADSNYTRYLNSVLVGGRLSGTFTEIRDESESPVLSKVMSEMRENLKNENEYRKQFLGPQIGKQMQFHEIQLRKAQKQELKRQKEEQRAIGKALTKSYRFFEFGR